MDVARTSADATSVVRKGAQESRFRYRRDVDGLRAISVLPVVLYHFKVAPFAGGFVGVDVFFVISGFLITSLIYTEMVGGRFTVVHFYERRVRRILPALFFVLACSTVAALLLLFPRDLLRFAEGLGATVFFVSNIDFWKQSGYFDVRSDLKPLLHTWSLAVEEQFYLFFPPVLLVLHSRKRTMLLAFVTALFICSFALSVWSVYQYPSAAFYLAPQRTWELMLGSMLALAEWPAPRSALLCEFLALTGLALLGFAIFFFNANTRFPGEAALVPCLGAALLIYCGENTNTWVSRSLSWSPLVFLGLISYSLYLWHWPLFVFVRYASIDPLDGLTTLVVLTLSVALAVFSWRYVEQPFRAVSGRFSRRDVFLLAGFAMAGFASAAALIYAFDGLPHRFEPAVRRILAEAEDVAPQRAACVGRSPTHSGKLCVIGDKSAAAATFMVWGDSHADSLLPAIEAAAAHVHRKGYFLANLGCPPLPNIQVTNEPAIPCSRVSRFAFDTIRESNVHEVVLVGRWAMYDQGRGYGPDQDDRHQLVDLDRASPAGLTQHEVFRRKLAETVSLLRAMHIAVVVVASVPEVAVEVPERLALLALRDRRVSIGPPLHEFLSRQKYVDRDLIELRRQPGVRIVEPAQLLCAGDVCKVEVGGTPLYRDAHHLSRFGALTLTPLFASVL